MDQKTFTDSCSMSSKKATWLFYHRHYSTKLPRFCCGHGTIDGGNGYGLKNDTALFRYHFLYGIQWGCIGPTKTRGHI